MASQIAKFMGPTWDPTGFYRPQIPGTLLSGITKTNIEVRLAPFAQVTEYIASHESHYANYMSFYTMETIRQVIF